MTLDLLPAFLMAVLACWLGLSLLVRSPRDRAAQAFAWLCLNLTLYGLAIVLGRLAHTPAAGPALNRLQLVETALLPPVFLHFVILVVGVRRMLPLQRGVLLLSYAVGAGLAGYALLGQAPSLAEQPPRFPGVPLTVVWAAQRALPLLLALALTWISYRQAGEDDLERRRRAMFALAAVVGVAGALWATATRGSTLSQAPGHVLMDASLALLAYTVLAYRLLLPPRVARRAFYRSLLGSLLAAAYVAVLLLLERLSSDVLGMNTPLVTVFALVILIAVFSPLRDAAGDWLDRLFFHREFDYGRLLRALGEDLFERGDLADQLHTALTAICRMLGVRAGVVAVQQGVGPRVVAAYGVEPPDVEAFRATALPDAPQTHYGDWPPWPAARLLLPLRNPDKGKGRADQALGLLALGAKRSGEPYRETERALLFSLGSYLALAIKHARARQEEELAMAVLAEQADQLRAEQELLAVQAAEVARMAALPPPTPADDKSGLRVFALGPLRVERDGAAIERWGGDKAGTYQAEALFAFLFDRRGRGLTKDEAEEVIWEDLDLEKADTAFHRTISALRRTLEPGLRRGNESRTVAYHHERYWLDPSAVAWCDADAFATAAERGHTLLRQGETEAARTAFAEALALYRGDYMDDCPFFGDSSYVEERRVELRGQRIDTLLALGTLYERLGQAGEAATCYRRALAAAGDCPRAEEGLARLQVGIA
jgi:DNA-binding SARP family transcriptional activator/GAF domain-containing protein